MYDTHDMSCCLPVAPTTNRDQYSTDIGAPDELQEAQFQFLVTYTVFGVHYATIILHVAQCGPAYL